MEPYLCHVEPFCFIDNDIPFISQKSQSKEEGGLQQPIKLVKKSREDQKLN